jgi:hypothetical protein
VEISVKPNDVARVAAENNSNSLLKVEITCTVADAVNYTYYRISNIVGGTLYQDEGRDKSITDGSIINSTGVLTTLWLAPDLYNTSVAPSFFVEQIAATREIGGSMTMTLNLLDPKPHGPSAASQAS